MKLHEMAFRRAPVLIVGGGPVGLYASVLLSRAGVPSVLLERAEHGPVHPRAHLINTRSMELLREVGLEGPVHALAPPLREWREFRYCHSLLGRQIAVEDHMAKPEWEILRAASPTRMTHVSQPGLEALLREEAERLAPAAGSKLLFGYECTVLDQVVGGGVQVQARRASADERTANGRPHSSAAQSSAEQAPTLALEGSALLACDGAHSRVRQALGLELKGNPPLQYFKSVHFRAPSLYERLKHRPAMLYFVFHQEAVAVLVAHHMGKGEWVAQLPFFPPLQDGSSLDEVECGRIIQALVGAPIDDLQVCSAGPWRMVAAVSQRMSVGRVHLLGDAAHQFPPAGAFGMNTGLQDAHNICWKLAAVHAGIAGDRLLASYDAERRPVAHSNARLAVHNYERGLRVAEALGLPSSAPQSAADAMGALKRAVPQRISRLLLSERARASAGSAVDMVRARMLESLEGSAAANEKAGSGGKGQAGAPGSVGTSSQESSRDASQGGGLERRMGIGRLGPLADRFDTARLERAASVVESGQSLPLLFPRHELGFVYEGPRTATLPSENVLAAGVDPGHSGSGNPSGRRAEMLESAASRGHGGGGNQPGRRAVGARAQLSGWDENEAQVEDEMLRLCGQVGSRLPHHWLTTDRGVRVSTLDLLHGVRAAEAVAAVDLLACDETEEVAGSSHAEVEIGSPRHAEARSPVHAEAEVGSPSHEETRPSTAWSTINLPTPSTPRFTLLIDAADRTHWGGGAALLPRGTPLQVVAIAGVPAEQGCGARLAHMAVDVVSGAAGLDMATVYDQHGGWADKVGATRERVALLVRPDGHVAWRGVSTTAEGEDTCKAIATRIETVIGRNMCRTGAEDHASSR